MSSIKERAMEIYKEHLHLASTNGKVFRKTVMDQLMQEFGASLASVATHYNNCKKSGPVIEGLGRAAVPKTARKMSTKSKQDEPEIEDDDCFTVIEILQHENNRSVGRTHSFEGLGLARIKLKECITRTPAVSWVLIQGLGPNHGDTYKLGAGEKLLDEHNPESVTA